MSWDIEEEEVRQLLALPAADRAVTFFQLVADWEEAWGLKDAAGWIGAREGAAPEAIPLGELLDDLLPLLAEDGLAVAVFPAPGEAGTVMPPGEVRERLERELELGEW